MISYCVPKEEISRSLQFGNARVDAYLGYCANAEDACSEDTEAWAGRSLAAPVLSHELAADPSESTLLLRNLNHVPGVCT